MKKHLLLLFLFTTTLALAKENYIPFNNSEIILSINGKELEIVFDIENISPIVELKKSDEKTSSILESFLEHYGLQNGTQNRAKTCPNPQFWRIC